MKGEYYIHRAQLRGHLFELIVLELIERNNFQLIDCEIEDKNRVRQKRNGFIEIRGRGAWHQIDCPCDYKGSIPFSYQLRLLGEVKCYRKPVDKKSIREFIGVIRDIQENYVVPINIKNVDVPPRRIETGVFFSASGFQEEAEKLAYAHGIKTISYANNIVMKRLKELTEELEGNYISVAIMHTGNWNAFKNYFSSLLKYRYPQSIFDNNSPFAKYLAAGFINTVGRINETLIEIRTSFFATTANGVFIHFIGDSDFPKELFSQEDVGYCRVFYNYDDFGNKNFWLEMRDDSQRRRFYFAPPVSLDEAALYGNEKILNEKERLFRYLNVNIKLDGINRNLILKIDRDWLHAIRKSD